MKIFSNFDTNLRHKTFETYKESYGEENVICFGRSKLYRVYKIFAPFLLLTLCSILLIIFSSNRFEGDYSIYILSILIIVDIMFLLPILGKYIDYKMDFIIVIPSCVMLYDQGGFFQKNIVTLDVQNIRAISIQKSGLLYSIFDNGDLIILTEGEAASEGGEIILRRIPRPDKRKNQMVKIIGLDLEANQNPK